MFCNSEEKKNNPTGKRARDAMSKASQKWKELTDEERKPFNEAAILDRARYHKVSSFANTT
jgi:hypothetical protein